MPAHADTTDSAAEAPGALQHRPFDNIHSDTEITVRLHIMASLTLGNAQIMQHKQVVKASIVQLPRAKAASGASFGPKLGCRTQALRMRRAGLVSASRQAPVIVAAAKGYKVYRKFPSYAAMFIEMLETCS
jgi:hypothetical protein